MSPLSELVWSPDEGLSIKIAASSLSTRKASLRWNADTLSIVISSPQHSGAAGKSGDNVDANQAVSEKMPSQLRACSETSMRVTMSSQNRKGKLDAPQSTSMRSQEQDSRINVMNEGKKGPENFCVDKLEVEMGSCKDTPHGSTSRKEGMPSLSEKQGYCTASVHNERSWATNAWRARLVKAVSQKDSVLPKNTENSLSPSSLGTLCAGKVPGKLVSNINSQCPGNDSKEASNIPDFHSHDNCQGQVLQESNKKEHVAAREESASGVNPVARCESAFGINARNLEKGREKVMYSNSNCVSHTKESDDSNESIESCQSTKAPKRKHTQCSAPKMYSGNKRCKREDNESSCSGLLQECGSSFFNWMSSLTHGLVIPDETTTVPLDQTFAAPTREESIAPPLPIQNSSSIPVQSVGFNSLFQSLYSHNVMITSRAICHQPEKDCTEHVSNRLTLDLKSSNSMLGKRFGMGRETLDVDTEILAADNLQMVSGAGKGNFHNQFGIFPLRAERNLNLPNSSKSCSRSVEEKQNECPVGCSNSATGDRGGFAESLWVSRFLPKTSMKCIEATPCDVESDFCAVNPKGVEKELNDTNNFTSKGSSNGTEKPQEEPKQSETIASVFAKRLDALKHAKTSAVRLAITRDRGIYKRSNHRTSSFVVSYSSHDELEAGQDTRKSSSENGRMVFWTGDRGKEKLRSRSNEESRGNFISEREHQHPRGTTAGKSVAPHNLEANPLAEDIHGRRVERKEGIPDFMESLPDNKQIIPYGIMSSDLRDESIFVFGALHMLRLSRSDIIRWLRSPIMHTTLDGFFVRLRFGKWEEALGGTGYHVARLNGALDRNRLSVTIRNSTCQVGSCFVSNHDFHEDELKAWWSAAMKGDWKLPSKEELNMKLRERGLFRS